MSDLADAETHIPSRLGSSTVWEKHHQMLYLNHVKTGWDAAACVIGESVTFSLNSCFIIYLIIYFKIDSQRHDRTRPPFAPRTCFDSSHLGEAQRVGHSQVPVQRYAAEEGDADIDVRVEDEAEQLAAPLTVDPVITLQEVVDPQGEGNDVEEVRHRQVDQVDAELVALAYLEGGER